ncbi:DJ-1/PfpI family protein [Thermobacillus sp.]|uniref:DJ-1/PfpI family protein n=1 Tax=Thermobacillus sp. TaxID=2108467 RepID=UPI00257A9A9A|nr:DJ-1/PfpI family protein [Thermobacillus sp.]
MAAICGATAALAEAGLLDNRPHTSNSLEFLTFFCPNYRGASFYRDEPVVVDGRLITTGSAGALLLAREVMRRLDVMSGEALEAWYHYYSTGEAAYFYALMGAVSDR